MNNRRDQFECELKFEINQETYYIRRTGTRKKTGDVKVDVSFWRENPDGTHLSLNGEDRRDTNANIRSYVGSYEDFVLTTLSSQNASALFIDKSHSERKDLLIQFMGLNIFDKLFDAANEESKELTGALKKFKKVDFGQLLADTQVKLDYAKTEEAATEDSYREHKEKREILDAQLASLKEQRKPVPDIELNLGILQKNLDKVNADITLHSSTKLNTQKSQSEYHARAKEGIDKLNNYDTFTLSKDAQDYASTSRYLDTMKQQLQSSIREYKSKQEVKTSLDLYKFNPNCDICKENGKSHFEDLSAIETQLAALSVKVDKEKEIVNTTIDTLARLEPNKNLSDTLEKIRVDMTEFSRQAASFGERVELLNAKIESLEHQRIQIQRDIELYHTNEANIKTNEEISLRIGHIERDIATNKQSLDKLELSVRNLHGQIKVLEAHKAELMNQIKEAEELEDTYEAYKYYMEAICRDGIPYELMARAIPAIESEINNILTQIVEFTISLEVDGKNIVGKLNYDHERIWPLENSSGMERFISSLAIRVALLNASNLPKPNFMIIDEGLGVLDAENLSSMGTMFSILKSQFDFLIVISHLDTARDMVDKVIEIKREDGWSYINC
jgi:DNA repair exonuclease SbcCD ATPase subunit